MDEVEWATLRCLRSSDYGLLGYLPTFLFFINYFIFLNKAIKMVFPRRQRVATAFRWGMAFTLTSQAYEIWTKTISIATCLVYEHIKVHTDLVSLTILAFVSLIPLFGALAISKKRVLQMSWTIHGPRTELGPMRYYLNRPPPMTEGVGTAAVQVRSKSQENVLYYPKKDKFNRFPKHPRTA